MLLRRGMFVFPIRTCTYPFVSISVCTYVDESGRVVCSVGNFESAGGGGGVGLGGTPAWGKGRRVACLQRGVGVDVGLDSGESRRKEELRRRVSMSVTIVAAAADPKFLYLLVLLVDDDDVVAVIDSRISHLVLTFCHFRALAWGGCCCGLGRRLSQRYRLF